MYDAQDLPRSELYFEILQILRIFSESIAQNVNHLENLSEIASLAATAKFRPQHSANRQESEYLANAQEVIAFNWTKVKSLQKTAATSLLVRLDRKIEEIKSLRDGVSKLPSKLALTLVNPLRTSHTSFSMLNPSEKPHEQHGLTSVFWGSP